MRLSAALAASVAFALVVVALSLGVADLAGGSARVWMQEWEEQGNVGDAGQLAAAFDRLQLAHRLDPLNADIYADLGRLMDWQSWRQTPGGVDFEASRARARDYYLRALGARPSWGFVWAHYAENQFLQGETGSEFRVALQKAIDLSPWEPGVQRKVAWMGMATWESLPEALRQNVKENIERAVELNVHRYEIVRMAAQYDWLQHLVPMMRSESQQATLNFVLRQIDRR